MYVNFGCSVDARLGTNKPYFTLHQMILFASFRHLQSVRLDLETIRTYQPLPSVPVVFCTIHTRPHT
uniref:Ovule protein n=1 Tax=Steinernema glaseri TaxID=37863 RepID=A0A1I7ZGY2_9BILA